MRLRPNVALQQTGRLLMERAPRALLLIALQLNLGVRPLLEVTEVNRMRIRVHTVSAGLAILTSGCAPAPRKPAPVMQARSITAAIPSAAPVRGVVIPAGGGERFVYCNRPLTLWLKVDSVTAPADATRGWNRRGSRRRGHRSSSSRA